MAARPESLHRPGLIADIGGTNARFALSEADGSVRDAVVLIDREQGAGRRLEELGVRLHSMLTLEVLLTYLHEARRISDSDYEQSIDYLRREGEARSEFD